jgi:hypothetical protein
MQAKRNENLKPQDSRFMSIMLIYYMVCILGVLKKYATSATEAPLAVIMRITEAQRKENLEPQDSRFISIMFLYYMVCILGDLKKI